MTTFTVYNSNSGEVIRRGLSAVEAAQEILSYDSHDYDLRHEDDVFSLYVTRGSNASFGGNRGFAQACDHSRWIYSRAATESDAWRDIAMQVIAADWSGHPEAMPDAEYDAAEARLARENEDNEDGA